MAIKDILRGKSGQPVHAASPDTPVRDAVRAMVEKDISSLLVCGADGRMAGLVTLRELLRGLHAHGEALLGLSLREVMQAQPVTASPDDSIDFVRGVMTQNHVTHLPILEDGRLVGIISFYDVAKAALNECNYENVLLKRYIRHWPE